MNLENPASSNFCHKLPPRGPPLQLHELSAAGTGADIFPRRRVEQLVLHFTIEGMLVGASKPSAYVAVFAGVGLPGTIPRRFLHHAVVHDRGVVQN